MEFFVTSSVPSVSRVTNVILQLNIVMLRLKFSFRNKSADEQLLICESISRNISALPPEHREQTRHEELAGMVGELRESHERIAALRSELKSEISRRNGLLSRARTLTTGSANLAAVNMNSDPAKMLGITPHLHSPKTPVGLPPMVTNLRAAPTATEGEAMLRWKRPLRECSFEIEAQTEPFNADNWKRTEFTCLKQSRLMPGLISGAKYRFRVRASNAHGPGPWSEAAIVRVK